MFDTESCVSPSRTQIYFIPTLPMELPLRSKHLSYFKLLIFLSPSWVIWLSLRNSFLTSTNFPQIDSMARSLRLFWGSRIDFKPKGGKLQISSSEMSEFGRSSYCVFDVIVVYFIIIDSWPLFVFVREIIFFISYIWDLVK